MTRASTMRAGRPATISISDALLDARLLGAALGDAATWRTWLVVLRAAFGLRLSAAELEVFASVAGDRAPPSRRVRELWCVAGRRGGKSRIAAALAVFAACFVRHKVAPGERLMCLVLSASVEQSKAVFGFSLAFLRESPILRREIVDTTANEIRLRSGVTIAVHANSFRSVRGRTLCACIFDEVSFWRDDSTAVPDVETYSAILPSLLTTDGLLVGISSPYRKSGLLHAKHKAHFGVDGDDVLVVQGSSRTFNPSLNEEAIAAQRLADPTASASEWDAEFRADITGFLDDAVIDRAINLDRPLELPPDPAKFYVAHVDPSGGAVGGDSYSIAVVHREKDGRLVVDVVRGRQGPFSTDDVTFEYAWLCEGYGISRVVGDNYSAAWVQQTWAKTGVRYEKAELNASMLYLESLPLWTRGHVEISNHKALVRELRLLERIPGRVGKDQVTHPRNVHDDLANSVCGALAQLAAGQTAEWMRPENLRRARLQAEAMPKYHRPVGPDARAASGMQFFGERRYLQIQAAANRRRHGF
jgi:hypothetical protein